MSTSPRTARLLVLGAVVVGMAADSLLRPGPPLGLGATIAALLLLGTLLALQRTHQTKAGPRRWGYAALVGLAALGLVWRDSHTLKPLDVGLAIVAFGLLASERAGSSTPGTLSVLATRIAGTALHTVFGPTVLAVQDIDWSTIRLGRPVSTGMAVVRGLLLALPLLIVFSALLASADADFGAVLAGIVDIDLVALAGHVVGSAVLAWLAAGYLRAGVLREEPAQTVPERPAWLRAGVVETATVLALVDLLFGLFVALQLRYLFGGARWLQATADWSYAEYARRGFFELVAVAALVLPLLLAGHWALGRPSGPAARLFGALAGIQVALVLLMLASALDRMRLYRDAYGLTELRVYTTAFMLWLGFLLLWFTATVLRDRRAAFAQGLLVSAVALLIALHAYDPDRRIVEWNARRPQTFDVHYALRLSADAVPALIGVWPTLSPEAQTEVVNRLAWRYRRRPADWRSWSYGLGHGEEAVAAFLAEQER